MSGSASATGFTPAITASGLGRDNYPNGNDVKELLTNSGLTVGALDVNSAALAGRMAMERLTDRQFLATTATREYDPPVSASGVLDLGADLFSLTGITYGGAAFASGTDFRLMTPGSGSAPYQMIRFNRRWAGPLPFSLQGSLLITGLWGYGTRVPEDVWEAMRAAGAISLLPAISFGFTGGLVSWSDEDTTEQYGKDPLGGMSASWSAIRDGAVARYRRVAVGL